MKLSLRIWRQANREAAGRFVDYAVDDVSEHCLVPRDARRRSTSG